MLAPASRLFAGDIVTDSVRVYFRQGKSNFEPRFNDNGEHLDSLVAHIHRMQGSPIVKVEKITLRATASPEGGHIINHSLAQRRGETIADYLSRRAQFDRNNLEVEFIDTDWKLLEKLVARSDWDRKDEVLPLLRGNHDDKELRQAVGKETYEYLFEEFYPKMRGTTVFITYDLNLPEIQEYDQSLVDEEITFDDDFPPLEIGTLNFQPMELVPVKEPKPTRHWYLKTNFLTYPFTLTPNLGIAFEIGGHFSISIPFYYSALDWFRRDRKFRIAGTQPEVRYWFRNGTFLGPFVGAHFTFGWWNIAPGDGYRYQDHDGKRPTTGGGIEAGWKIPLGQKSKHPDRWGLEFTLGFGYMPLYSDKFYDVHNGMKIGEIHKNYWGIDNAAVSLTYKLNYKKRRNAK